MVCGRLIEYDTVVVPVAGSEISRKAAAGIEITSPAADPPRKGEERPCSCPCSNRSMRAERWAFAALGLPAAGFAAVAAVAVRARVRSAARASRPIAPSRIARWRSSPAARTSSTSARWVVDTRSSSDISLSRYKVGVDNTLSDRKPSRHINRPKQVLSMALCYCAQIQSPRVDATHRGASSSATRGIVGRCAGSTTKSAATTFAISAEQRQRGGGICADMPETLDAASKRACITKQQTGEGSMMPFLRH